MIIKYLILMIIIIVLQDKSQDVHRSNTQIYYLNFFFQKVDLVKLKIYSFNILYKYLLNEYINFIIYFF